MHKSDTSRIILGIDPGYDRLGWGVLQQSNDGFTLLGYGAIRTQKGEALLQRYAQIIGELGLLLKKFNPAQAAIETLFFSKNKSTALAVSEARGVILATLLQRDIQIYEYSPGTIKLAVTGSGRADKAAVDKMLRMQLRVSPEKLLDDTADALAIALTHAVQKHYT